MFEKILSVILIICLMAVTGGISVFASGGTFSVKIEGETAVLKNGTSVERNHSGYSGKGFIAGYWNNPGAESIFTVNNVPEDGVYKLGVHYSQGFTYVCVLNLIINNKAVKSLTFTPTPAVNPNWETWSDLYANVILKKGTNTLEFYFSPTHPVTSQAMNLDYITISGTTETKVDYDLGGVDTGSGDDGKVYSDNHDNGNGESGSINKFEKISDVQWVSTTASSQWTGKGSVKLNDSGSSSQIIIDPDTRYQRIDGWGGCFNELGWQALSVLSQSQIDDVMKNLFDKSGANFTLNRMPIGASDFALSYYSLNDTPGDYSMSHFNIDRDKNGLIKYIKAGMKYSPDMKIFGSPWTPPAWMKENNYYSGQEKDGKGGYLTWNDKTLKAYALYFEKYVKAYRAEGINIYGVSVQNEPTAGSAYPGCIWNGERMKIFIRDYLGPQFEASKLNCDIILGTINSDDYNQFIETVLSDSKAKSYIGAIGFQYAGKGAIAKTAQTYPNKTLMQTETECGSGVNDWGYGENQWGLIRDWMEKGANSYIQWNMVLDQTGMSTWDWKQSAMITVNKNAKQVIYNPHYYAVRHYSNFVQAGAYRVKSEGSYADKIAFINPDGSVVIEVMNSSGSAINTSIQIGGQSFSVKLDPKSFNTFLVKGTADQTKPTQSQTTHTQPAQTLPAQTSQPSDQSPSESGQTTEPGTSPTQPGTSPAGTSPSVNQPGTNAGNTDDGSRPVSSRPGVPVMLIVIIILIIAGGVAGFFIYNKKKLKIK